MTVADNSSYVNVLSRKGRVLDCPKDKDALEQLYKRARGVMSSVAFSGALATWPLDSRLRQSLDAKPGLPLD